MSYSGTRWKLNYDIKKTWSRESRVRFPLNVLYQASDMSTQAAASIVISLSNSQARPSCRSFSSEDSLFTTIQGQTVRLLICEALFFLVTFKAWPTRVRTILIQTSLKIMLWSLFLTFMSNYSIYIFFPWYSFLARWNSLGNPEWNWNRP